MKSKSLLAGIVLYIASSATSFGIFNYFSSTQSQAAPINNNVVSEEGGLQIDPGEPLTEVCPLNGEKFTATERSVWETKRPLAVMVENSVDARPQSGITKADIVYEAVAEGGVTRFMFMMYCDAISNDYLIAPVRSARTHFVNWASEYNQPMYSHVGGANCSADKYEDGSFGPCKSEKQVMAIEQIASYGWRLENDVDGMSVGLPVYYRDESRLLDVIGRTVATEHSMHTSTDRLWEEASERDWTNTNPDGEEWLDEFETWTFQDESGEGERGAAQTISYDFWDGYKQYDVQWKYDPATNTYARETGGEPHTDLNNGDQVMVKNVIVQFVEEEGPVDELKHMYYENIGTGEALIFRDGQVVEANWSKPTRTDRTVFTDKSGDEINLTRGKIWISMIDDDNQVAY